MASRRREAGFFMTTDIGGTKSVFSVVESVGGKEKYRVVLKKMVETQDIKDIYGELNVFLSEAEKKGFRPFEACLGVAGLIRKIKSRQTVKMTNADIVLDSEKIKKKTGLMRALLLNDMGTIAYATNILGNSGLKTLVKGKIKKGVRVILAAGTSLGKGIMYPDGGKCIFVPLASEGGHCDFPAENSREIELLEFIKKVNKIKTNATYGNVLSGKGIEDIYAYLRKTRFPHAPGGLNAGEISESRKKNVCSREALGMFFAFLARCARNLALDTLSDGGVYIAGGIAQKNPDMFGNVFEKEFVKSEMFSNFLKEIPLYLITDPDAALKGAAFALKATA